MDAPTEHSVEFLEKRIFYVSKAINNVFINIRIFFYYSNGKVWIVTTGFSLYLTKRVFFHVFLILFLPRNGESFSSHASLIFCSFFFIYKKGFSSSPIISFWSGKKRKSFSCFFLIVKQSSFAQRSKLFFYICYKWKLDWNLVATINFKFHKEKLDFLENFLFKSGNEYKKSVENKFANYSSFEETFAIIFDGISSFS